MNTLSCKANAVQYKQLEYNIITLEEKDVLAKAVFWVHVKYLPGNLVSMLLIAIRLGNNIFAQVHIVSLCLVLNSSNLSNIQQKLKPVQCSP